MQSPRSRDDLPGPQVSRVSAVHELRSRLNYWFCKTRNQDWCGHLWDLPCDSLTHAPSPVTSHLCALTCDISPVHPHLCNLTCDMSPVRPHLCNLTCDTSPVQPHLWHLTCATSPDTLTWALSPVQLHLCHPSHLWQPPCISSPVAADRALSRAHWHPGSWLQHSDLGAHRSHLGLGMNRCWFQQALKNRLVSVPSHSPPSYLETHLASPLSNSPISQRRETIAATSPGYSLPPKSSEKPAPWTPPLLLPTGGASVSEP